MTENRLLQGSVDLAIEANGLATITFSHPAHNSLPGRLLARLVQSIESAGSDEKVKLILLKSGGDRTFCAGASFDELSSIEDLEQGKRFFMGFANVINAIRKCPKLVIGRIQGKAVGGGVGVAAATDYCFATQYASVKLSELAIGIGPFVIGPAVERKVGTSAFSHMAINATAWMDAVWAQQKGLFMEVYDSAENMDEAINKLINQLLNFNPEAMQALKKVFWEGTYHWDQLLAKRAAMSGQLVLSDFTRAAINAFKNKN
ncbi:MAG: enoyl-CoA hydratase/isomerase family protein [Bacteroidota bacterium]